MKIIIIYNLAVKLLDKQTSTCCEEERTKNHKKQDFFKTMSTGTTSQEARISALGNILGPQQPSGDKQTNPSKTRANG